MTENTPWRMASGAGRRYPYWVVRYRDGKQEYAPNKAGDVRKFKTMEAAEKFAAKLQVTADFDDSREHMRLATHHMIQATDGLQPGHPLLDTLAEMADMYIKLTGEQL